MNLVIFDVDGTLVHSEKKDSQTFADTYEAIYDRPFPTINWHTYPHVTDYVILNTVVERHFQRSITTTEKEKFEAKYLQLLAERRKQNPQDYFSIAGAPDLIQHLEQSSKHQVAIATGGWKLTALLKLEHVGISAQDKPISGGDAKPNRELILNEALDLAKHQYGAFERVVYVGDATWDVRTTRNLRMNFIGIRHRNDKAILEEAGAKHVLQDFRDRGQFLDLVERAVVPA
ncbi:MAG: HAD family hydrolase [Bacteroidota bacterium]